MQEWINQILNSDHMSFSVVVASFLLGIIGSVTSCCNFAIIGAVAGYSTSLGVEKKAKLVWISGISFLVGTVISMAILGALMGYLSDLISDSMGSWWKLAAGLLAIFFGLVTLNLLPFKIPSIVFSGKHGGGIFSALIFGLVVGGITVASNSCCNPVFPIILGASFLKGSIIWGLLFLVSFGIGYGLPMATAMIGLGIGVGKISSAFNRISKGIKYFAGALLIIVGFYFLLTL
jgi:cytochrome c biogenesis protein CcdA